LMPYVSTHCFVSMASKEKSVGEAALGDVRSRLSLCYRITVGLAF
jgi:hypothetical protein